MEKKLLKLTTDLLKQLDIKPVKIDLTKDEEETLQLNLELSEEDTGILIGYHGDTIISLQLLLGLMLFNQTGSWTRLIKTCSRLIKVCTFWTAYCDPINLLVLIDGGGLERRLR